MISTAGLVLHLTVAVWFGYRLIRYPHSRALRAIVGFLILHLADSARFMDWLRATVDLSPVAEKLLKNTALAGAWCCLMLFFLFAAGATARRAGREVALLAIALVTMTVAVLSTPNAAAVYPTSAALAVSEHPSVLIFYVVGNLYFAYATGAGAWWAERYAAESSRRSRVGLRLAAVGLAVFSTAHGARVVMMLAPEATRSWARVVMPAIGASMWVFVLGVCLAGAVARLAALRVWFRHRRRDRELVPLWNLLHQAFPDDSLPLERTWWDRFSPRQVHRRYWRRVVECRDGLVQLSPWLSDAGWTTARRSSEQVPVLLYALQQHAAGLEPSSGDAQLVAVPAKEGLEADVDELVQFSRSVVNADSMQEGPYVAAAHHRG